MNGFDFQFWKPTHTSTILPNDDNKHNDNIQIKDILLFCLEFYPVSFIISNVLPQNLFSTDESAATLLEIINEHNKLVSICVSTDTVNRNMNLNQHIKLEFVSHSNLLRELYLDPLLQKFQILFLFLTETDTIQTDLLLLLLGILVSNNKKLRNNTFRLFIYYDSIYIYPPLEYLYFCKILNTDSLPLLIPDKNVLGLNKNDVAIFYLTSPTSNYISGAVNSVNYIINTHLDNNSNVILLILASKSDIDHAVSSLSNGINSNLLSCIPLYNNNISSYEDKTSFFQAFNKNYSSVQKLWKVIIACNINFSSPFLELSVNIDFVIDCGFYKIKVFNPISNLNSLNTTPISKSIADFRSRIAGANKNGECYRVYTLEEYQKMREHAIPDCRKSDLAQMIVFLKGLGISNLDKLKFPRVLPIESINRALQMLNYLNIIDLSGSLTEEIGQKVAFLNIDPRLGKILISSQQYECTEEILSIISCIQQIEHLYNINKLDDNVISEYGAKEGDHLTLLNIYNTFILNRKSENWCKDNAINYKSLLRATNFRANLQKNLKILNFEIKSTTNADNILKCLLVGLYSNIAIYQPTKDCYQLLSVNSDRSNFFFIHSSSVLYNQLPNLVVFQNLLLTTERNYIAGVSSIKMDWLFELMPDLFRLPSKKIKK